MKFWFGRVRLFVFWHAMVFSESKIANRSGDRWLRDTDHWSQVGIRDMGHEITDRVKDYGIRVMTSQVELSVTGKRATGFRCTNAFGRGYTSGTGEVQIYY